MSSAHLQIRKEYLSTKEEEKKLIYQRKVI